MATHPKRKRPEENALGFVPLFTSAASAKSTTTACCKEKSSPKAKSSPKPKKETMRAPPKSKPAGRGSSKGPTRGKTVREALGREEDEQENENDSERGGKSKSKTQGKGAAGGGGGHRFENNVVLPVTVHQLLASPALFLKKQWIGLVGQLLTLDTQVHETSFQLDDGSSQICCKADPELAFFRLDDDHPESKDFAYVFLVGLLNTSPDDEPQIIVQFIEPLRDFNRLTHHMLSVRLMAGLAAFPPSTVVPSTSSADPSDSAAPLIPSELKPSSSPATLLLQFIREKDSELGVGKEAMLIFCQETQKPCDFAQLNAQLEQALHFLETSEALIYEISPGFFRAVSLS